MSESCSNCRFYRNGPMPPIMVCAKNTPQAVLVPQTMTGPVTMTYWPSPAPNDWCGEWKAVGGGRIVSFQQGGNDESQG